MSLGEGFNNRDGEKWLGLGYISEVKQTGFANGLDMVNEENKEIESDS